ncbi:thiamine pyrophosphate-requiring protein [Pseudonocardia sp. N23]|uniref:thiamine pyrophosphate-requiring protein n=1 Tax=Pseudonocardia sp. N23 TaxID=1987376 RepID=UPI000BFC01A8|nr:thiamine pyrophosphate-requiring protein [Pseudonocardia sp. N23]GAY09455.1 acetolactate synthase large subunit [Pseudonocardia sp. N23]
MNVAQAAAEVLRREGVEHLFAYPLNPLIDAAAAVGIRPVIVRQERIGIHMADAVSRLTDTVGVFCMQAGPGVENSFGAVAQAFAEGIPLVVIPGGAPRAQTWVQPAFNAALNFQHVTKWAEQVTTGAGLVPALRRAFTQARNGRPGPVLVEIPADVWAEEAPGVDGHVASGRARSAPDAAAVDAAVDTLVAADRPLLYAGQGVHHARAWTGLRELAELLEAPVTTSLEGKSAFPETHPLSLGSGGVAMPRAVFEHVRDADVVFGVGASFTATGFGIRFPTAGKTFVHNTVDPVDLDKHVPAAHALIGDAGLTLATLTDAVRERVRGPRGRVAEVTARIRAQNDPWLAQWRRHLDSDQTPLSPYRVIRDLMATVDVARTIITHDAGSPRDELSPFWRTEAPHTYLGWGKSTQLGYGLGLAMGAKLARPDMLCVNVWGDAAIGMTGMDLETCARVGIPILSVLLDNSAMAMEDRIMALSRDRYGSTDISGDHAAMARALGLHAERVTAPDDIVPALRRAIAATGTGTPALVAFVTTRDKLYSTFDS